MPKPTLYVGLMQNEDDDFYNLYLSPVSADVPDEGSDRFESEHMLVKIEGNARDAATAQAALNRLHNILVAGGAPVVRE